MAEKYFSQTNWSKWETLLVIAMVIFGIVITVVPNGIPYGGLGLLATILTFCFYRSAKVKDSDIDRQIELLLQKHQLCSHNTAVAFDFRHSATRMGKDHKLRSPLLWAVRVDEELTIAQIDLLTEQVKIQTLSMELPLMLTEQTVVTPTGNRRCWFLTGSSLGEELIPVNREDAVCEKLILPLTQDTK